ncbi:MAG: LysE family transporter [Pseudomonadota bacterium]
MLFDYIPNPLVIPVGLAIGVLVAAPVGPVNVLCIQRALERGFWGGVAAGSGAVLGDALIALSASLGVGYISGAVQTHRGWIQLIGGAVLVLFGLRLLMRRPEITSSDPGSGLATFWSYWSDIPKTFLLTVTNPGAVLGLFAIFGGIGSFVSIRGYIDALFLVAAIAAGSLAWWIFLSLIASHFRDRFDGSSLRAINLGAGILLVGFGAVLVGEIWLKKMGFAMISI